MPNSVISSVRQTWQNIRAFVAHQETSTPEDTVKSSFQRSQDVCLKYMAYRWFQCALHMLIYLVSFLDVQRSWTPSYTAPATVYRGAKFYAKWFLYLTHWGVFLNVVQSLLGAIIVTVAAKNRQSSALNSVYGIPLKLAQFYRYAFGVALNLSLYITLGFWILIYNPEFYNLDLVSTAQHGLCTLLLLLDMFVVKFPYKLVTGVWTCALGLAYEQMLIGHHFLGALDRYQDRPYLYEVQNWSDPVGSSIVVLSAVLTIISFNFLLWGLYLVKRNFIEVHHHISSN